MNNRVVITGIGVVSPIGNNIAAYETALREGKTNMKKFDLFEQLGLDCVYGAIPEISDGEKEDFTNKWNIVKLRSPAILYGCMAGIEAWQDAGLLFSHRHEDDPDWNTGCMFGTSCAGVDAFIYNANLAGKGKVKSIGGRAAQQAMNSGISAYLGGILGLGNQVSTNSNEGITGIESVILAYYRIAYGHAQRMLAGSTESSSEYIFDAYDSGIGDDGNYATNQSAEGFLSPMSNNPNGFIVGAGSGALVLESLESALARNAKIYAEITGCSFKSSMKRNESAWMTIDVPSFTGCIQDAISMANIHANDIDYISGCLQSNYCDPVEIQCLTEALGRAGDAFPFINATKSLIGHCLSASGSMELVATLLQMRGKFIHPSKNSRPLHPSIENLIGKNSAPDNTVSNQNIDIALKVGYSIGNVYSCIVLKQWNENK
ncbi:MAG: hypothetical protein LBE82_00230 [Chitinophagaceae bacterium]|jgi:3-oxoacyl-(acyl-carrier-protein) synthase|nr:hypothetical protein [Chitinophagaceae bacterium]